MPYATVVERPGGQIEVIHRLTSEEQINPSAASKTAPTPAPAASETAKAVPFDLQAQVAKEKAELAARAVEQDRQIEKLKADAPMAALRRIAREVAAMPTPTPTATTKSIDPWDDPKVRAEFGGNLQAYRRYERAVAAGVCKPGTPTPTTDADREWDSDPATREAFGGNREAFNTYIRARSQHVRAGK